MLPLWKWGAVGAAWAVFFAAVLLATRGGTADRSGADVTRPQLPPIGLLEPVPGDPRKEALRVAVIDAMSVDELLNFLDGEPRSVEQLRERPELYVGRMKHRALERLGELRYEPGIPYLVRDIDFYFPPVGKAFEDVILQAGDEYRHCPAPPALRVIGQPAVAPMQWALKGETDRSKRYLLSITLLDLDATVPD